MMPFSKVPAPLRPWILPILSVVAGLAIILASLSIVRVSELQEAREQERVEGDIAACERGNALRQALTDFLAPLNPPNDPATAARLQEFLVAVAPIDCQAVTPGTDTNDKENP